MLLPMLSIYQEYVRNHHYCLQVQNCHKSHTCDICNQSVINCQQVLTECKQTTQFASLLHRLEKKPACKGRSLETFLTYPMHQVWISQCCNPWLSLTLTLTFCSRFQDTSSLSMSSWHTPHLTMLRKSPWSMPGSSWKTCPGKCTTR